MRSEIDPFLPLAKILLSPVVQPEIIENLRQSYDRSVAEREFNETEEWKKEVRQQFVDLVKREAKSSVLDLGAGTGVHALFLQSSGLDVLCADLSSGLVQSCLDKGLKAIVTDMRSLEFDEAFDAVFSLNSLLHISPEDLPSVISQIYSTLKPDGLFYWGQYGGVNHQGTLAKDHYQPKRYFSFITDNDLHAAGATLFDPVSFEAISISTDWEQHFQSSIWRRRDQ